MSSATYTLENNEEIESPNKEIDNIKKNQMENVELKNLLTKIKTLLNGFNSRMEVTEGSVSECKDRSMESSQSEKDRKILKKKENTGSVG